MACAENTDTASVTTPGAPPAAAVIQAVPPAEASGTEPVEIVGENAYDDGPRTDVDGIAKFAHVSNALYRGAQPDRKGFEYLKKLGVKTIVNLRSMHSDRKYIKGLGFQYLSISFKAFHPEDEDVVRFIQVISNKANWPIFVHCQQGVDRTGMMVAIYRMYFESRERPKALAEMKKFGFHEVWVQIDKYLERIDLNKLKRMVDAAREPKLDLVD
jgi:protein tyrosine/serine phosphatase